MQLVLQGSFASSSQVVVVHEQNVYTAEPGKIQVRTFQVPIELVPRIISSG